jgi:hypothetical protein
MIRKSMPSGSDPKGVLFRIMLSRAFSSESLPRT